MNPCHDFFCGLGLVHGINMDILYVIFLQVSDLADGIIDTCFSHLVRLVSIGGNDVGQLLGDAGTGKGDGSP